MVQVAQGGNGPIGTQLARMSDRRITASATEEYLSFNTREKTMTTETKTKSKGPPPHLVDMENVSEDGPMFEDTDVPVQYLFKYLDETHNLYAFLDDFPQVSAEQALAAIRDRVNADIPIRSDRERVSGLPVFDGTRVPVRSLFNYLSYGYTIEGFLENFPTAERKQVLKTLELASAVLESVAYETAAR